MKNPIRIHGQWEDAEKRINQFKKIKSRFGEDILYWATTSLSLNDKKSYSVGEKIIVSSLDSLTAAKQYKGKKIIVLNMASHKRPGGGVLNGAPAQEEDLFRRTNLYQFLNPILYPLNIGNGFLSKDVIVCCGTEEENFSDYSNENCFCVDVMTIPAPVAYNEKTDQILLRKAIRLACQTSEPYDVSILSAFGCGAFGNDPEIAANIFKEELQNASARFVEFAILPLGERGLRNFEIFKNVFCEK